ncbi:MAG: hypothetical protein KKD44_05160 [Proteobacteria bacterium]|nr:hypothetical protein [Pseudomonadota bacterium]
MKKINITLKQAFLLFFILVQIVVLFPCSVFSESHTPATYDGIGKINAINISRNYISIDDIPMRFSSNPVFLTLAGQALSPQTFKKGDKVGYVLDSNGKIKELWFLG